MRIALGIEYDGTPYHGWQRQRSNVSTVQSNLENALSRIADTSIHTYCAGRTDTGVHAIEQVVHFDTKIMRPLKAWHIGTNTHLPPSIRVRWAKQVNESFHARFSALARCYRYLIDNQAIASALFHHRMTWHPYPLDIQAMQKAAHYLKGEHDFSAFRSSLCQSRSSHRCVEFIRISTSGTCITLDIQANAFLHHMVRNIVGVLLAVGGECKPPEWCETVLRSKDRRQAGITAPASGLYLLKVIYALNSI